MLEHLVEFDPEVENGCIPSMPLDRAPAQDIIGAQLETAQWLENMGVRNSNAVEEQTRQSVVHTAFMAMADPGNDDKEKTRLALLQLKTPPAVRQMVGMLTAYDWAFVEQAQELRGYAVHKILEETKHPDARIRLKALDMLGRVTEVALFTDRIEIKKTEMSTSELDAKIKEKLRLFMGIHDAKAASLSAGMGAGVVQDAQIVESNPTA